MDTKTNKGERQGQPALDALTELVESEGVRVMIGNSLEVGAVHLVIPRTLVLQTQTMNAAHLSRSR